MPGFPHTSNALMAELGIALASAIMPVLSISLLAKPMLKFGLSLIKSKLNPHNRSVAFCREASARDIDSAPAFSIRLSDRSRPCNP